MAPLAVQAGNAASGIGKMALIASSLKLGGLMYEPIFAGSIRWTSCLGWQPGPYAALHQQNGIGHPETHRWLAASP
eukprot:12937253-Prorocentrum_lima.AAC.1